MRKCPLWIVLVFAGLLPALEAAAKPSAAVVTPPRTLELQAPAEVRQAPEGDAVAQWEAGTLLTSDRKRRGWVRVTGYFPDGSWRPAQSSRWIPEEKLVAVRPVSPKQAITERVEARTFQTTDEVRLRDGPRGHPVATWDADTRFTVRWRRGDWLKVSGHFPDGVWQEVTGERWLPAARAEDISPPPDVPLPADAERYIVVDKSDFALRVVEEGADQREVLVEIPVGLGMDDCLPEEHGGECYYTEPGEYRVRWRIYRPDGIDWCIPESMAQEPEYAEDLAQGKRCFEGVLGRFALNIGKSYAIHGTQDVSSIGKKESHGCIRARPEAVRKVWRYMREGDRVVIRE